MLGSLAQLLTSSSRGSSELQTFSARNFNIITTMKKYNNQPYTEAEINSMSIYDVEQIAHYLNDEQRLTWAEWGYGGEEYLKLLNGISLETVQGVEL